MRLNSLLDPQYRWIATGKTYQHRETLQSWAWFYIGHKYKDKSAWAADHITSENDMDLQVIINLEGVKVEKTKQVV